MAIEIDIYSGFDHENSMVMIKMVIFPSVFCNVYVNVDQRKTSFGDGDFGVWIWGEWWMAMMIWGSGPYLDAEKAGKHRMIHPRFIYISILFLDDNI